jgi:hypothetical protein
MEQFGVPALYLPQMTTTKPDDDEPAAPIFTTRQADLSAKKNVIIIINDHMQDLGVWAYRKICDDSFDAGSCTGTIKALKLRHHSVESSEPGLVILNPGQYYYSHRERRSLTHESWEALPKKSLFHPTVKADGTHNLVAGSHDMQEHITTVFEKVVNNEQFVRRDADLYIVGIGDGANGVLAYLNTHWSALCARVKAAAWVQPYADTGTFDTSFAAFLETRTRSWTVSTAPLNTCLGMPDHNPAPTRQTDTPTPTRSWEDGDPDDEFAETFFCPTFSGGEEEFTECVFPKSYKAMLDFFDEIGRTGGAGVASGDGYVNPVFEVVKPSKNNDDLVAGDGVEYVAREMLVKDVDRDGVAIPDAVEKVTERVKKVELQEGEVEVAGVAVAKTLLQKAGLD